MRTSLLERHGPSTLAARRCRSTVAVAITVFSPFAAIAADPYPAKPVRVIISSSPGGLTDVIALLVTTRMGQQMAQTFVAENRTGVPVVDARCAGLGGA